MPETEEEALRRQARLQGLGTAMYPGKPPVLRPVCPLCGTWQCATCGHKRSRASLHWPQQCSNCLGTTGTFLPTRHTNQSTREDHEDYFREHVDKPQPIG